MGKIYFKTIEVTLCGNVANRRNIKISSLTILTSRYLNGKTSESNAISLTLNKWISERNAQGI